MKWPQKVWLIRHDVSEYNVLKRKKNDSPLHKAFVIEFEKNPASPLCIQLAHEVAAEFKLGTSDHDTILEDIEAKRAEEVGRSLCTIHGKKNRPHVIFVSPYVRTKQTLQGLKRGWPSLQGVKIYEDERIREQSHGLASLYSDWRVFHTLYPDQGRLYRQDGSYWYKYPNGEDVPNVRERNRSWMTSVVRDFAGKRVLVVTHHLNILALRANLERWDAKKFIRVDNHDKPHNCGVTLYQGYPDLGKDGRLKLEYYNRRFFTS